MPFPLAEPLAARAAAGRPAATIEAADLPAVAPAAAEAAAAAALAAGGGRRAGAFILGHPTPARLKETIVHVSWSKALWWWGMQRSIFVYAQCSSWEVEHNGERTGRGAWR